MRSTPVIRARLLIGAGLAAAAIGLAAPALGQDAQTQVSAEQGGGLEEIVVTAQRREENLRDVPIAINAITANALKDSGILDTSALVQAVPSLNFTRSGPSGIFVIRGVSTPNGASGEEGSTAVYIDDVYMPDLASTINTFNNIERIEVLNGPQGTLFGRNAVGGLIRIMTRDPGKSPELNGQMGYGNYATYAGQLYAATPLSDKVGINLAFTGQAQTNGFGINQTLGRDFRTNDYWGLRSKLVAEPAENLKITIAGEYFWTHDTTATFLWTQSAAIPVSQNTRANYPSGTLIKVWGVSGKAELDLGAVSLTSISSYRDLRNHSNFDVDAGPTSVLQLFYETRNRAFQQEVRLASTDTDPLSWQVGAFYLHLITDIDQTQTGSALGTNQSHIVTHGITDSVSVFGEATYSLTPTTHVTGGLRWTSDSRKLPIGYTDTINSSGVVTLHRTNALSSVTYSNVTFRAALRQELSDTANIYASVNKGFKSGQFNLQSPHDAPVRPQTIMAYEVGAKADLLDRRIRVSLAAFHYDISDYQVRSSIGGISALQNAAKVDVDGVDFNAEAAVAPQLRLTLGASWLNSRYAQFGGPGTGVIAPGVYPPGRAGNATGNKTALAPSLSVALGGTYTIPLGDESELRLTANYTHKTKYFFEANNVLVQPAYNLVNASVEYKLNEHAALEFYVRNMFDELYNVQEATSAGITALAGPPRQYGANFKFNF
jgi:iron complex outermembrane recepter protein